MIDFMYKGISYILVLNKKLFNCINVLFAGFIFIEGKQYKKYVNCENKTYLVEV